MNGLEPVINLLLFLTALSVAAERVTNVWKLRSVETRTEKAGEAAEKDREQIITVRSLLVGCLLALLLKADFIAALNNLDAPWQTLGWVRTQEGITMWAPETRSMLSIIFAVLGSIATGLALGFGSKFWHEMLDTVLELRTMAKNKNEEREVDIARKSGAMKKVAGTEI